MDLIYLIYEASYVKLLYFMYVELSNFNFIKIYMSKNIMQKHIFKSNGFLTEITKPQC